MCKFTNRLFVFALLALALTGAVRAGPTFQRNGLESSILDIFDAVDNDYDLHYDQRQKGDENFRLKLDGFFIGMPSRDTSSALMLLTDDVLENLGEEMLLSLGKSQQNAESATANSLKYGNSEANNKKVTLDSQKPQTIIVEIPAPKRELEARNSHLSNDEVVSGSRTKQHLFHLLSLLKRGRRN